MDLKVSLKNSYIFDHLLLIFDESFNGAVLCPYLLTFFWTARSSLRIIGEALDGPLVVRAELQSSHHDQESIDF